METLKLGDLVEYRSTGFISIISGALMNNVDLTFFLRNTTTVSNWINTLLSLNFDSSDPLTEQVARNAGIPSLNLNDLLALGNSPLRHPVTAHLSLEEFKELNDMSLTILLHMRDQNHWSPTVRELVQTLGLDGLETKVCLYFINEVTLTNPASLPAASPSETMRVLTKIIHLHQEENLREIEFLSLCQKIEEGVWLTKQILTDPQLEDLDLSVQTTRLLEVTEEIFGAAE